MDLLSVIAADSVVAVDVMFVRSPIDVSSCQMDIVDNLTADIGMADWMVEIHSMNFDIRRLSDMNTDTNCNMWHAGFHKTLKPFVLHLMANKSGKSKN